MVNCTPAAAGKAGGWALGTRRCVPHRSACPLASARSAWASSPALPEVATVPLSMTSVAYGCGARCPPTGTSLRCSGRRPPPRGLSLPSAPARLTPRSSSPPSATCSRRASLPWHWMQVCTSPSFSRATANATASVPRCSRTKRMTTTSRRRVIQARLRTRDMSSRWSRPRQLLQLRHSDAHSRRESAWQRAGLGLAAAGAAHGARRRTEGRVHADERPTVLSAPGLFAGHLEQVPCRSRSRYMRPASSIHPSSVHSAVTRPASSFVQSPRSVQ
mmetsp:Transcript_8689/g.23920  ORF Transcript_8689/g.23920 Transcript_8689/m.23920 type:complete len:274 (-) Transcript_8689:171-992(-)